MASRPAHVQPTLPPPYRGDAEHLMQSIRTGRERMFARTARWPCAVRLHPADEATLILAVPQEYTPLVNSPVHVPHMDCLLSMIVIRDWDIPLGASHLERCRGCEDGNTCEHSGREEA